MATRIILIRHGDPGYRNTFAGRTDVPLADGATEEARRLGEKLKAEGVDAVYSSRLKRAAETGKAIGDSLGLAVSRRFRELNELDFGKWEMMTFDDVEREYPGEREKRKGDMWNYNTYGGESLSRVRERVMPVIRELIRKHEEETFVVVAHGIVMRVIYSELVGTAVEELFRRKMEFLSSIFFKKDGDKIEVEKTWGVHDREA
jgi:broad specificity phosphatase PhoE